MACDAKTQTVTLQVAAGTADGGSHNLIQPPANAPERTRTQIEAMNNISRVLFKYAMVASMKDALTLGPRCWTESEAWWFKPG